MSASLPAQDASRGSSVSFFENAYGARKRQSSDRGQRPGLEGMSHVKIVDHIATTSSAATTPGGCRTRVSSVHSIQGYTSVDSLTDMPLRRGKWTTEEQHYSELLIQYFLAGVVPNCADGTTLRAFLSAKLHCAPMRITKKFAGATLGKSIFYRTGHLEEQELYCFLRPEPPSYCVPLFSCSQERLSNCRSRLQRLETNFVRSEIKTSAEAVFFSMRGAAQHGHKEACVEGSSTSQTGAKRRSSKSEKAARHGCDDAPIDNPDSELSPKARLDCTQSSSLRRAVCADQGRQAVNTTAQTSRLITTEQMPMRQNETEMPIEEHGSSSIFWPRPRAITLSKLGGCTTTMLCESECSTTFGSSTLELTKNGDASQPVRRTSCLGSAPVSEEDLIAESAAVVAAHAKAAANAAMRGSEHEDGSAASTWAARVAERAALVTAARRDAELRAARLRLAGDQSLPRHGQKAASSDDFGIQGNVEAAAPLIGDQANLATSVSSASDVACAAVRAAEAASHAAATLTACADEPEARRRQVLMRAIDNLSDVAQSSHDFCDPSQDDACATHHMASEQLRDDVHFAPSVETTHETKRQRVSSDGLPFLEMCDPVVQRPQPSSELYSELYGWVPANLGITASAEELSRHLGLKGEPQQQSPLTDEKLLVEGHPEAHKLLLGDDCNPSPTLVSCSPTRFATEGVSGRMLQCRVSRTQHMHSDGVRTCDETETSRQPEDRECRIRLQGGRLSSKPISLATTAVGQQSLQNGLIPRAPTLSSRSITSITNTSSETTNSRVEPFVNACSNRDDVDRLGAGREASQAGQSQTEVGSAEHSAAHSSKHQTPTCTREVPSGSAHFMGLTYRKLVVG